MNQPAFEQDVPDPRLVELCRQMSPDLETKDFRQIEEEANADARAIVKGEKQ